MQFAGPFVKAYYGRGVNDPSTYADNYFDIQRAENNPAYKKGALSLQTTVPIHCRRTTLIIQNQGETAVRVFLSEWIPADAASTDAFGFIIYPKQSISFDNYNGGVIFQKIDGAPIIYVAEAFA